MNEHLITRKTFTVSDDNQHHCILGATGCTSPPYCVKAEWHFSPHTIPKYSLLVRSFVHLHIHFIQQKRFSFRLCSHVLIDFISEHYF